MEKLLVRLVRQLDALDEASLMSLWSKYATIVDRFEPTKRWEEAALVFSLIQGKRWKNQLFNYYWALQSSVPGKQPEKLPGFTPDFQLESVTDSTDGATPDKVACRVLPFKKR
ncbi:MAG: conserved hypothetical protein [Candidatus Desulfovibrio kirbyi]|uniref:Uncharacterized protein n=1 Tax=Candidatus Desulfovibrio kirbyi TaxID=2696086 RepID=A0A6L2R5T0_9BACT|nr:MAG: conserved hypothetical protein [Candidatus Desulfovibrio kirbyi]